ncbi:hypothetical protein PAXRUDRAFT_826644 [Paxillus rubicundulus Ve08.2h10]|uniref:Uncharacterized protein n=1 Tax=Paxillus rubicundulus Ve08.2h10 TaxID=930991 RepID=A0A0D0DZA6_9AGAM|nr:hypothetical protein PAXRUDRAFT_826644 [Paxillus rubicundulus Ve08.2h10]
MLHLPNAKKLLSRLSGSEPSRVSEKTWHTSHSTPTGSSFLLLSETSFQASSHACASSGWFRVIDTSHSQSRELDHVFVAV